ncbi:uroporphyrinogen-III synthase [Deinococcus multiflagellatus]|uniref:Uroporphyrinogen-III synthase n=1 Tax=Deinococcus multiflagellatus TaxID=1656887 RepID=A0ABW1ZV32_9DEIO|nr:uroporphyrinogen-III synthase [Deinococcus multiflagellatus]MBZ9715883.1 uroporphyrinogen-III synthase [Deinococcus multiflagellatus]
MDWFAHLNVLSLESRRSEEMEALIRKYGGTPQVAPSMREVKLDLSGPLTAFERDLNAGDIHAVACLTGVGTRMFLKELAARDPKHLDALRNLPLIARGSKPAQALKAFGLPSLLVPKPCTWHEVTEHLLATLTRGQHAVVLEYGEALPLAMRRELGEAGIRVTSIPVYRCAFPQDTGPLARAVRDVVLGGPDILLLSSGTQLLHFLKYAEKLGLLAEARAGLARLVVVSIGPACSEAAADLGLRIDLEANPHKMGILVRVAAEHAPGLIAQRLARAG